MRQGYALITGGRQGVGYFVSLGAHRFLTSQGWPTQGRILALVPINEQPDYDFAEPMYFGRGRSERRRQMLRQAPVFLMICGRSGTTHEYEIACRYGTPVIPLGITGGAARVAWSEILSRLHEAYQGRISLQEFQRLNEAMEPEELARLAIELAVRLTMAWSGR